MNNPQFSPTNYVFSGASELVRGQEQKLLDELNPLVRNQSVYLDLSSIERIDAAGLAALITLYCDACKAGHSFKVLRPGHHVREILALVGLDRILLSERSDAIPRFNCQLQETAA